jgi:SAM-dependent methyltransferase
MSPARNVFLASWVGTRYARARPGVHSAIAKRVRERVALDHPLALALDVGCGTGHSTAPLRSFVEFVVGLDASAAMVAQAPALEGTAYAIARAEALPVRAASCDLVSIGLAYHWCDPGRFLSEAARVLGPDGWLVVYDSGLVGGSPESDALFEWLRSEHWSRLVRVPRNPLPDPQSDPPPGFSFVASEFLHQDISMPLDRFVEFLTTQSGAVATIEQRMITVEALEARLRDGLARFVDPSGALPARMGGPIHFLRRLH